MLGCLQTFGNKRMLEILNVDSGEGYMLMSEKYRKIKEELKALGLKVRVHLL